MSNVTPERLVKPKAALAILNELGVPTAQALAAILNAHIETHACKCITDCYRVAYPFGHDIVRQSSVNPEGLTGIAHPPPFISAVDQWLGIVVRGNVVISTTHGLSTNDSWKTPPSKDTAGRGREVMIEQCDCLKYRTTIERVLGEGDIFFVWELVSTLADKYFSSKTPLSEPYVYDISSGKGYPLLVWPLRGLEQPKAKGAKRQQKRDPLQVDVQHQLLRYSCALLIEQLTTPSDWKTMESEVLWLPCKCLVDDSQFREFAYAVGWRQSAAKRQQVARYERVQEKIRPKLGGRPYLNPDEYGPCIAATLCYLDDALSKFVPLHRFVEHENPEDPFFEVAASVKRFFGRRGTNADAFLLAPHVDGQGGILSLSMPIAPGPVPSAKASWSHWRDAFQRIWSKWPQGLANELGELTEWKNNGGILVPSTMGKRGEGDDFASRNCPFFRAWVELSKGTKTAPK